MCISNKAHVDPNQVYSTHILREKGTRCEVENMQIMLGMREVKLHIKAKDLRRAPGCMPHPAKCRT